jgi:vancomycin resistance protein YoaR
VVWEAVFALLVVALIVAGVVTLLGMELWLTEHVLPGVYVMDVDVGGLTPKEAVERLQANFKYPADRQVSLRHGDQSWVVQPQDLGTQIDIGATVSAAYAIGHGGKFPDRIAEQIDVILSGRQVLPVLFFDVNQATMFLNGAARQINRPLRNATLSLGEGLDVQIIPGQTGREVDEEATRQVLFQRLSEMGGGSVDLIVRETEPLLADVSLAQAQVQRILSGPISLTAPGFPGWTIEPATLADWLILRPINSDGGDAALSVSLDSGQALRFVEDIAAQVVRLPVDAQFRFDHSAGTVAPVVESSPGQTLEVTSTVSLIESAASSIDRTVALPLREVRPALSTEDAPSLGITELIAQGKTSFAGSSASRAQNIAVGASQFDGILIAPGETFSFNHYLGEITTDKGYEESIIIWGNTTRADVGGGLCQVSSTAFRAAFWAGLPIVERTPHAFRVSYYEPPKGMDATIYSPTVDFKWVNDTGHHILIHTYVDRANSTLTFNFYGTNPGRTVERDGPYEGEPVPPDPPVYRDDPTLAKGKTKQIEWAKDGLDVTVYRIVKENGSEVRRDTFRSLYRPWQAVYLVGTKED